ncbi:3-hydroxyacyl-CoA dehydrogenase family protein [Micromonospora sagamiensis]|uniref:3-hydroxyacyl-CoA dehydrogenase n=1 Tax=Micromonospora sagamiensis TaxID=47875 RepID=A0A562WB46_9ACTN|nr:3-hydroxyacyl-CoA dehydrogenase [Micromonospora sagamiensis]TWJ27493.1 3-hydroxyacyl-CoA dehydrogenase [Micromonospora sagamiensis]BCL13621.1 3-hydroxybutyryl-CoA dehydrogenase [Micromonospora sagamiensis]
MAREFTSVGVVGLGTMGAGIVEVFARNGVDVVAVEIAEDALERGRATLTRSTDRAVAKGKLAPADRDALLGRVNFAVGLAALDSVDLVIEAVPERLDLKRRLFADLDRVCKPEAILATNTSSLSVTEIAVATKRPDQVIGVHFFNPAPVMKLVEVVRTVVTAPEVVADVEALCARLGKIGVTIGDRAGFIANHLLFGYLNQAIGMVEAHYATREDIDAAMKLGCGLPMGPLALLDLIGLDTAYEILDTMYRRGGRDRRHAPVPLLRQMVTAGLLGRKSGRGFYTYERPGSPVVVPDERTPVAAGAALLDGARTVATVGVVGGGTMATGIVEALARAGYQVVSVTRGEERSARVRAALTTSLDEDVTRERLDRADRDAALARVTWSVTVDDLADVDLVVEAVVEDLSVKKALFASLDGICKPGVVLATTTSSLPVVDLAMATGRPADVVGLHFFHPAPVTSLVEVVRTIRTSPEAVATARAVAAKLDRTAVVCGDRAGFIVNALLFPYLNDAVKMLEANYSTVDDIDHAMKLGCGYPTGPFALLDEVGLDVALTVQREVHRELREPGVAPAPLLEHLVTVGYLGRRSGRGFRDHSPR